MKSIIINLIKFYQKAISPWYSLVFLGNHGGCRFYPSCSEYAIMAVDKYGFLNGLAKSLVRILKCNPWSKGGINKP